MRYKIVFFIFSSCFLLLSVVADEEKFSFNEMVAALENLGESCETKPKKENIREVLLNIEDVERETKCFRRCLMELLDLNELESTKMREETALELGGILYPEKKEEFRMILQLCNRRNADIEDKCDAAHEHFLCLLHELRSNGFEIMELKEEKEEEEDE